MAKPPPTLPPPKPTGQGGGLDEVDRALSVLEGRHPDHVRVKRELDAVLAQKRAELDGEGAKQHNRRLARALVVGLLGGGILAAGWSIYARQGRARAVDAALEPAAAPYVAQGFVAQKTADGHLEESVEAGCFLLVSTGAGVVEVEHGGETLKGTRSVAWCACTPEHVEATVKGSDSSPLRLLRVDGSAVGGLDGLSSLEPRPATISARVEDCSIEQFDAWISTKHAGTSPAETLARGETADDRTRLLEVGFLPVSFAKAGQAFALVEPSTAMCHLAFSRVPGDVLSLRLRGGERPLSAVKGHLAWCESGENAYTVWREGTGDVVVLRAPAARIGGQLGLREKTTRAHVAQLTTWMTPDDLAWDAVQTLAGSGVPAAVVTLSAKMSDPRSIPEGRLVAISLRNGGAFVEPRGDVPFACDPKGNPELVCAQMAPQTWRQKGTAGAIGVAQAPLPFWLAVIAPAKEPELAKRIVLLLALARRLHGEQYEPTTLEGVTESASGVEVIGRGGDDAVIAVGLGPNAPWIFPYSDGVPWDLGEEPRVVELKPGERALLSAVREPTVPKEARRTVVFRRPAAR